MAILIWMASPSVKANTPFPFDEYEAHYIIRWRGIEAGKSIHTLLKRPNGQYHFQSHTKPHLGMLPYHYLESSDFSWEEGKILPQHYHYNIHEGNRRKKGNVIFDWKNHKLHNHELAEPWEHALEQGVHDKITQGLSLRHAIKTGQPNLDYVVAEIDKIKNYTFTVRRKERIKTQLGLLETLVLEHTSEKGHRTTLWLAINYDYLPVKMAQSRSGKVVSTGEIAFFAPRHSS